MQNSSLQIMMGASISYISLGINILASLIYLPWMVSMIGKSGYALYSLASSIISLIILDFGLSVSVSRFVAKFNAEGKQDRINEVVCTIARVYCIIDFFIIVIFGVLFFFLDVVFKGLTIEELYILRQLYIIVAITSIVSFPFLPLNGILDAYELFVQQKCADLFNKLFSIILIVLALLNGGDVRALVIANAISAFFTIILKIIFIYKNTNLRFKIDKFNKNIFKEVASFSVWITIIILSQRCIFSLAPSILGIVSSSTEIAVFAPANVMESYFFTIALAVNGLFLATVSRYVAHNENEKIYSLMVRVGRYQMIILGLVLIEFFCIGYDFMICWLGTEFTKTWLCTLLLFIPDFFILSEYIAYVTVTVKNKVREQAIGYIIMAISCVTLSFPLSSLYGAIGACLAIAIAYFIIFIYMNIIYYKELKINVFNFYKECYLKLICPMIFVSIIGYILTNKIIFTNGWFGIIIKGITVLLIYIIIMMFFINKSERDMVKKVLNIVRCLFI